MENIQLTQAETHFRGWEQERSSLIARTKEEIKKQILSTNVKVSRSTKSNL